MSDMSYCRPQNTPIDLIDCYNNLIDLRNRYNNLFEDLENLSVEEKGAKERLIALCYDIAQAVNEDEANGEGDDL